MRVTATRDGLQNFSSLAGLHGFLQSQVQGRQSDRSMVCRTCVRLELQSEIRIT
eukprot:COSAG02_NODE_2762_length_8074_cov_96.690408_7_plen_54_part_00